MGAKQAGEGSKKGNGAPGTVLGRTLSVHMSQSCAFTSVKFILKRVEGKNHVT